jgi:hypothetical protein
MCLSRTSPECPQDIPNRKYVAKTNLVSLGGSLVNLSELALTSKGAAFKLADRVSAEWEGMSIPEKIACITQLDEMSRSLGYFPMWVYWKINEGRKVIDVFTLKQIARLRGYERGWIYHKELEIREKLQTEADLAV